VKVHLDRQSRTLKKLPVALATDEPGHAPGSLSCGEGRDQGGKGSVALTEADRVDADAMEIRRDQRGVMPADDSEDLRGVRLDRFEHGLGSIDLGRQRRDGDDLRGEPSQGSRQIGFQPQVENLHVVIGERCGQGLQGQRLGLGRHMKPDLPGMDAGLNQEDAHTPSTSQELRRGLQWRYLDRQCRASGRADNHEPAKNTNSPYDAANQRTTAAVFRYICGQSRRFRPLLAKY
jgi:hypothetical protein